MGTPPLKLRKFPDPVQDHPRRTHGRTTGYGVMEFWHYLFKLQEIIPVKDRVNDKSLVYQVEQEFPDRPQATQRIHEKKVTVGFFRWKYNTGILCPSKGKPRRKSYRYNEHSQRINGMSRKVLPDSQQPKMKKSKKR